MYYIFLSLSHIEIYIKELPDIMVFTPFYPTTHHSTPLYSVLYNLSCGRGNIQSLLGRIQVKKAHTSSR